MISKEDLKTLVETVSIKTGKSQEELAKEMGYGGNYISEMLSPSGKITRKFLNTFNLRYKDTLGSKDSFLENPKNALKNQGIPESAHLISVLNNLSESHKNLTAAHKEIAQSNNKLADNEKEILSKFPVTTGAPPGTLIAEPSIVSEFLELIAEIGIGRTWQTREEGLAEISRRLNVPSGVKKSGDHNVSGAGKRRIV